MLVIPFNVVGENKKFSLAAILAAPISIMAHAAAAWAITEHETGDLSGPPQQFAWEAADNGLRADRIVISDLLKNGAADVSPKISNAVYTPAATASSSEPDRYFNELAIKLILGNVPPF